MLIVLTGADAATIDTVAEFVLVAQTAGLGIAAGQVAVFNLAGNAYLFQDITGTLADNVVQLTGVTATGVSIIGIAGTGLVGEIFAV